MTITKTITIELQDDQIDLMYGIATLHGEISELYKDKVEPLGGPDVEAFLKQIEMMLK